MLNIEKGYTIYRAFLILSGNFAGLKKNYPLLSIISFINQHIYDENFFTNTDGHDHAFFLRLQPGKKVW